MKRASGIFLHITSLPSSFGIGDLGNGARQWVDLMAKNAQKIWQICPIGPVGYGYSPYNSTSAFAGNSLVISPELLCDWHYLSKEDLADYPQLSSSKVSFEEVIEAKEKILKKAWNNFSPTSEYAQFCETEKHWLYEYALFSSLATAFGTPRWVDWDKPYRSRNSEALAKWQEDHAEELEYHYFVQFIFHSQWFDLKKYANDAGVLLFGDVPYYASYESCDVWAHQELFELDADGKTLRVGGVPPDYFSEDGQLWGTPLYRWDLLREQNYDWWIRRFERAFFYHDLVRIDHFRAFESFWAVESDALTAREGVWVKGPQQHFFEVVRATLGEIKLIAEDLGIITDEVVKLRDAEKLPGMKVMQFSFDGNSENCHLPYNAEQNSVMYTGTHDNDTMCGWFATLDTKTKSFVSEYLGAKTESEISGKAIREALASVSQYAIIPFPDVLGLGTEARFNTPGTVVDNWDWRFDWDMISEEKMNALRKMTLLFGRG